MTTKARAAVWPMFQPCGGTVPISCAAYSLSVMATAYAPAHMSAALPTRNPARVMTCPGNARDTDAGLCPSPGARASAFRMRVVFEGTSVIGSGVGSFFHGPIETRMREHHSGWPGRRSLPEVHAGGRTIAAHDGGVWQPDPASSGRRTPRTVARPRLARAAARSGAAVDAASARAGAA